MRPERFLPKRKVDDKSWCLVLYICRSLASIALELNV